MVPADLFFVFAGVLEGPSNNVARRALKAADAGGVATSPRLIKSGVGRYQPGDLEALKRFSVRARMVNEKRSFGRWFETFAESGMTDNLWVYRSGDEIGGAMRVKGPYHSLRGEKIVALELGELESVQKGAGLALTKEGIMESKRLGLGGRIIYVSAPNVKTLAYHTYLQRIAGGDSWTNFAGTFFYYDEIAAENLLRKPISLR